MKNRIKNGECVVTHTDEERKALGFETNLGAFRAYCTHSKVMHFEEYQNVHGICAMRTIKFADFMSRESKAAEPVAVKNLADLIAVGECVNVGDPDHIRNIADHIRLREPNVDVQDMLDTARSVGGIYVKKYQDGRVLWMERATTADSVKTVTKHDWDLRVKASGWRPISEAPCTDAEIHERGKKLLTESRKAMNVPKDQSSTVKGVPSENFLLASLRADVKRMLEIAEAKNHDYGGKDSNPFANFMAVEHLGAASAETGIAVRMTDKLSRIITLLNNEAKVNDESITDTLLDLANYALILKALISYKKQLNGPAVH